MSSCMESFVCFFDLMNRLVMKAAVITPMRVRLRRTYRATSAFGADTSKPRNFTHMGCSGVGESVGGELVPVVRVTSIMILE